MELSSEIRSLDKTQLMQRQYDYLQSQNVDLTMCPTDADPMLKLEWLNHRVTNHLLNPKLLGHNYFVTLTSTIENPSQLLITYKWLEQTYTIKHAALELTKKGYPHIHCIINSTKYLNKEHIYRKNNKNYVDVRKLKHPSDLEKVTKYINKMESKPTQQWLDKYNMQTYILT